MFLESIYMYLYIYSKWAKSHFKCVQVWFDPAGDGDSEEGWELIQGADRTADLHVQEQVNVCVKLSHLFRSPRGFWADVFLLLMQLVESHRAPGGQEHARLPTWHQGQNFIASHSLQSVNGSSNLEHKCQL